MFAGVALSAASLAICCICILIRAVASDGVCSCKFGVDTRITVACDRGYNSSYLLYAVGEHHWCPAGIPCRTPVWRTFCPEFELRDGKQLETLIRECNDQPECATSPLRRDTVPCAGDPSQFVRVSYDCDEVMMIRPTTTTTLSTTTRSTTPKMAVSSSGGGGLSTTNKIIAAAVCVGVVLIAVVILVIVVLICKRKRNHEAHKKLSERSYVHPPDSADGHTYENVGEEPASSQTAAAVQNTAVQNTANNNNIRASRTPSNDRASRPPTRSEYVLEVDSQPTRSSTAGAGAGRRSVDRADRGRGNTSTYDNIQMERL